MLGVKATFARTKNQFMTLWKVNFKELCEMLQVPKSYYPFKGFKQKILDNLDEINTKTDIYVLYRTIKKGRTVTDIEFIIQQDDFENFVKQIRKTYQSQDIILYVKDGDIFTLNSDGHIEKNDEKLAKGFAHNFWKFLYDTSKKEKLIFQKKQNYN